MADVPFPISDPGEVVDIVMAAVTDKTALVMLDHVNSPSGIVLPVEELVAQLEPDVPVLIDGAHAPGMIPLDVTGLGALFYTANCHKWMCTPKGSAFLYVAERHRPFMHAASISHGYNDGWPNSGSRFHAQFDWTGTDDPSARLSVGSALEVMSAHHADGWQGIRSSNNELVMAGRQIVADALGVEPPAPASMIGSIAAVHVPIAAEETPGICDPLMFTLHEKWAIEVPVFAWPGTKSRVLRVSAQQYNTHADYQRLADALRAECGQRWVLRRTRPRLSKSS